MCLWQLRLENMYLQKPKNALRRWNERNTKGYSRIASPFFFLLVLYVCVHLLITKRASIHL